MNITTAKPTGFRLASEKQVLRTIHPTYLELSRALGGMEEDFLSAAPETLAEELKKRGVLPALAENYALKFLPFTRSHLRFAVLPQNRNNLYALSVGIYEFLAHYCTCRKTCVGYLFVSLLAAGVKLPVLKSDIPKEYEPFRLAGSADPTGGALGDETTTLRLDYAVPDLQVEKENRETLAEACRKEAERMDGKNPIVSHAGFESLFNAYAAAPSGRQNREPIVRTVNLGIFNRNMLTGCFLIACVFSFSFLLPGVLNLFGLGLNMTMRTGESILFSALEFLAVLAGAVIRRFRPFFTQGWIVFLQALIWLVGLIVIIV